MQSLQRKVLRTICPDQKGLIARITNICYKHELNIVQNNEFVDHRTGRFFMRTELEGIFNDSTLLAGWLLKSPRSLATMKRYARWLNVLRSLSNWSAMRD